MLELKLLVKYVFTAGRNEGGWLYNNLLTIWYLLRSGLLIESSFFSKLK
jgi:hypothetical protein